MSFVSIGDLSQTFTMRHSVASAKSGITTLSQEIASGITSNLRKTVAGNLEPIAGIERSIAQIETTLNSLKLQSGRIDAKQDIITSMFDALSEHSTVLTTAMGTTSSVTWSAVEASSEKALDTVLERANTAVLGTTLFSGSMTSTPAFVSSEELLAMVSSTLTGVQTLGELEASLDHFFAENEAFEMNAFLGNSNASAPIRLSGNSVRYVPGNGLDPALKEAIKANIFTWALSGDHTQIPEASKIDALSNGLEKAQEAISHIIDLGRQIGDVQSNIETENIRLSSEKSSLESARNDIIAVDPYEATTKLQSMQQQLETLYLLSSRSHQVSLLDYM